MNDTTRPQDRSTDDRSNRDNDKDAAVDVEGEARSAIPKDRIEGGELQRAEEVGHPRAKDEDAMLDLPERVEDNTAD